MPKAIESALANTSLFSQCSARELKLVAKVAKTRQVRTGTTLLVEGEDGEQMFAFLTGSASVHRNGRKVASLAPGDVVGELGVLVRALRNATVTTTVDSEVAVIGRRALNKLLEALAERVRELDRHTVT